MTDNAHTADLASEHDVLVSTVADKLDAFAATLEPAEATLLADAFDDAPADATDADPEVVGLAMQPRRVSVHFRRAAAIRAHRIGEINPQPLPPGGDRSIDNIGHAGGGPYPR